MNTKIASEKEAFRLRVKLLLIASLFLSIIVFITATGCSMTTISKTDPEAVSPQYREGKFHNTSAVAPDFSRIGSIIRRSIFEKRIKTPPGPVPVIPISASDLAPAGQPAVYRLGHSSVLIHANDEFWLTDPVFSNRASMVQWAGPERFHKPPVIVEELPAIKGVLISHNHYDHLDKNAVKALNPKVGHFYVPLGVDQALRDWGVPAEKITALDWWQSATAGDVKLVATPAQHFSGRSPLDGNETLWASWTFLTDGLRIFYSGDSGYFDGFKSIGETYGPFDLTLIEAGAYDRDWPDLHMTPEQSIQAHRDLNGRLYMPVHNGTFDLGLHDWNEPFKRVIALADDIQVLMPKIGEAVLIYNPPPSVAWWLDLTGNDSRALIDTTTVMSN